MADKKAQNIAKQNRGIVLLSEIYGCTRDLCQGIDEKIIASDDGANLIFDAIYKRGPLYVTKWFIKSLKRSFILCDTIKRPTTIFSPNLLLR